jgi:flavin reductase (DIM6/NTAB) family NADH-FMN oxidoreductase RutF
MSAAETQIDAIDPKLFRQLLGCFPTGVAIVTTNDADGRPVGLTCNSFSSVSLEPPLVLFSLRKASSLLPTFIEAGSFAINILSQSQDVLSGRFASSRIADKFEGVAWRRGPLGTPLIDDCLASFECSVHARHEAGDHEIFIGEVRHMAPGAPDHALVFYKGAYMMLAQSLRELAASGKLDSLHLDQARRLINCMLLRLACQNGASEDFDAIERNIAEIENYPDAAHRAEASIEFFRLVTKAAHNDVLVVVAETLTTLLRHVLQTDSTLRARPELVPVRRKILAHMRERDPDAAEAEMSHYFDQLRRGVAAQETRA